MEGLKMKKRLLCLLVIFVLGFGASAHAAMYEYSLDITLVQPDYDNLLNIGKLGLINIPILSGTYTSFALGDAIPATGNWIHEVQGTTTAVYDDYPNVASYTPITTSGNIITYFSDVQMTFGTLEFSNAFGGPVDIDTYTTAGFQETAVPIPPTVLLLGAGLLGVVGIRRRVKS